MAGNAVGKAAAPIAAAASPVTGGLGRILKNLPQAAQLELSNALESKYGKRKP